ncbi:hypothetical protein [Mollivirus kamchatka]|nr:hypothetical protein [Mollivirus kamchatka]
MSSHETMATIEARASPSRGVFRATSPNVSRRSAGTPPTGSKLPTTHAQTTTGDQQQEEKVRKILATLMEAMRPVVENIVAAQAANDIRVLPFYVEEPSGPMKTFVVGVDPATRRKVYTNMLACAKRTWDHAVLFSDDVASRASSYKDHIPATNRYCLDFGLAAEIVEAFNCLASLFSSNKRNLIIIDAVTFADTDLSGLMRNVTATNIDFYIGMNYSSHEPQIDLHPYVDRLITQPSKVYSYQEGVDHIDSVQSKAFLDRSRAQAERNTGKLMISRRNGPGAEFKVCQLPALC